MFIGAVLFQWWSWAIWKRGSWKRIKSRQFVLPNMAYTTIAVGVVLVSVWSMRSHDQWIASQEPIKPLGTVLLIQQNMPTQFDGSPDDMIVGWQKYEQENARAAFDNAGKGIDLVVWPESTFSGGVPWLDSEEDPTLPPELELSEADLAQWKQQLENKLQRIYGPFMPKETKFLLGTDTVKLESGRALKYNSALWFDPKNRDACGYYAKQHLVLFGEYIPIVSSFPSLLRIIGLGQLEAGEKPMAWQLSSGATVCPSICFEDVLPHVIHSQIQQLKAAGKSPDMLINITNDGWFRGSSILDHHLNNAILVAVENRRPMLVAANLGISAWIDGDGRVVRSLPRMEPGSILAEPIPDGRWGWWQSVGDWPARILALVSCLPFLVRLVGRLRRSRALSPVIAKGLAP